MKKILSLFSLLMLFVLGAQAETKTWDFTAAMSDADVANLTADATNWSYTESSKRYENLTEVSGELKANGNTLEWTKGITFGTFGKGKLRLDNQKRLCLNGKGLSFTISTKKGATITIESQTASSGNVTRYLSATNLTVTKGFAAGNEKETNEGTVDADGDVTITTNEGGINIYKIVVTEPSGGGSSAEVTDVLTWEGLGLDGSSTSYADFSGKTFKSSAVYAGNASSGKGKYIQIRTSKSCEGIVTTKSGGKVKSITIEWNEATTDRVLSFYGKNEAYASAADLFGDAAGTLLGEIAANDANKTLTVSGDYAYLGIRSKNAAQYINKITIVWAGEGGSGSGDDTGDDTGNTGDDEEFQAKKDVTIDFTSEAEIKAMGFEVPEKNKGTNIESPFTYKGITFTPYAGSTPVRIFCANNDNKQYSLRLYKEKDGNKGGIEITAPTGYKITAIQMTGNSNLKNVSSNVGTDDVSKSSQLAWSAGDQKITTVKFENNGTSTVNINKMTISLEYIAHLINDTFDFNNAEDAAVANNSPLGFINEVHEINDTNGKNPSGAKMTITPNTNTADYPEDAFAASGFWQTMAGPQMRISGGYNGVTMKFEAGATELSEIKFNQTNWSRNTKADKGIFYPQTGTWVSEPGVTYTDVTFTVQADTTEIWKDGKLQEIVVHDMGQLWINSIDINPLHGVEIAPASGAELSEAIAAERAKVKNAEYIKVTLEAGGQYTVKKKIAFDATVIIEGNGAGIDATDLDEPLIALTAGTTTPKNQDKYTDAAAKDFNLLDEITINNVMIKNLKNCIVSTNGQDWAVENLTITNSIIQLDNDSYTFIRFDQTANNKGAIKNLNIQNNTIYNLKENKTGYFIRFANASNAAKAFGTNNGTSTYDFTISNNTIIRTMSGKDFANNMVNNAKVTMTAQNNIFYDVYRLYQLIQGNQMSTTTDNYIYYDVTAPQNNDQSRKDKQGNPYTTKLESAPFSVPTEALDLSKADGGLNLTPTGDASKVGDPRWIGGGKAADDNTTGIEAVKDAQSEGAWYTIQGVRVAQPTKGLYIHNGRKVVIK